MEEKYRVVMCIKPVKSELVIQGDVSRQDVFQMNPYDLRALENLIEIKKIKKDFILTCLCMGDKRTESMLRRTIAMGADEAVLVSDRAFAGSDTVATSYILSQAIKRLENVKLIVCGVNTIDGETGQVPQALAERLKIKHIIKGYNIVDFDESKLLIRDKDNKYEKLLEVKIPAMIKYTDFKTGIPTVGLLAMKKAKSKEIIYMDREFIQAEASKCGLIGSKTQVLEIHNRITKKEKVVLDGEIEEIANNINYLLENAI